MRLPLKGEKIPQQLRLNLFCEPPTLDSRKATDTTSAHVLMMLFEGLTRIGTDHKPHLALAEQIKISKDQTIYTFHLRESFWSNGTPVTADDFAYAWKKILDPTFPSLLAYKLYMIQNASLAKAGKVPLDAVGIHVLNARTLEVHLQHPTPYFLECLAFPTFYPICRAIDHSFTDWAQEAGPCYVCNGPFFLKHWEHESEIVIEKNSYYWDAHSVKLDSIHLAMIEDTSTEFYMFEMGELDWAGSPLSSISGDLLPILKEQGSVISYPTTGIYYFKINTESPPLKSSLIRQALALSIDRQAIVSHVTQGGQVPAFGLIPPMPHWESPSHFFEDHDLEKARSLFDQGLRELEITKEQFPPLTICHNTNREHQKIAQAVQQQWQEALGIQVLIENYDWKVYLSKINKQDYQIGRMGWVGDFNDPISFLQPFKFKEGSGVAGNNETGWEHPTFISLLDRADHETNLKHRKELLIQAEALLIQDMPIIPLYYLHGAYMKKPYLKNVYLSPLGTIDFKYAYIES